MKDYIFRIQCLNTIIDTMIQNNVINNIFLFVFSYLEEKKNETDQKQTKSIPAINPKMSLTW